jgi:transposase
MTLVCYTETMTQEEEIAQLKKELSQILERVSEMVEQLSKAQERESESQKKLSATQAENQALTEQLRVAQARIEELEKLKTPPPAFVKANKKKAPEEQKKARKKRDARHNRARPRSTPTQIVDHRLLTCPDCHLRLGGISLSRTREVLDVPEPPPIEVRHHRIYKGWCAGCQKWHEAPVDFHEQVVGQGRIGVRLASLIATLRTVMRLPIRQIQAYLLTLHGVTISSGEIVELLHRIKAQMQPHLAALKMQIRASPAIQADETGWREDGLNGYIWAVSTPSIRYYEYHHSRGGEVVKELIGEDFGGVLGSDFYAGYNIHQGLHQRCWVHFLRDVHELKEKHPHDEPLLRWAKSLKAIYDEAVTWVADGPDPNTSPRQQSLARVAQQHAFEQRLWQLCAPYVNSCTPMQTLCKRVEKFLPELFVFVAIPGVPAHNNLAERSVRPLVVARKISGGSRSPKGSDTRMGLASLFGTWMAQHLNPFSQCLALLISTSPLGQI